MSRRVRPRSGFRRGARPWAGSVVVLALAATAALTAATAARRTDTAFSRALTAAHTANAYVSVDASTAGPRAARVLDALDASGVVAAHGRFGGATIATVRNGVVDPRFNTGTATAYLPGDGRVGVSISRFRIVRGRRASPDRIEEVVVNQAFVAVMAEHVGDTIAGARLFGPEDSNQNGEPDPHRGTPLTLRIVGIVKTPDEALTSSPLRIFTTPAFTRRFPSAPFYYQDLVVLKHGFADMPTLNRVVDALQGRFRDSPVFVSPIRDGLVKAERAADPLVNGLWMLAALAFAVGVLLAGQAFARVLTSRAGENAVYRVIGLTRGQRLRADLSSTIRALAVAAALAVVAAWALSSLTPVGAARGAEPNPGRTINLALDVIAFAGVVVAGLLAVLPAALRSAFSTALPGQPLASGYRRPTNAAQAVANAGLGVPAVVGTQLAFEPGRGTTATPVVSVLASLALIVAIVTGTVAFGVNLDHLVTTKSAYGWNWDAAVGSPFATIPKAQQTVVLRATRAAGVSGLSLGRLTIGNVAVPAVGIEALRGAIRPTLVAGRIPSAADEIALGAKTLRTVHAHLDETITARITGRAHRLHVVGIATIPAFGTATFSEAGLGTGAIGPAALWQGRGAAAGSYNYLLLDYGRSAATPAQLANLQLIVGRFGCTDASCFLTDLRPNDIDGFRGARQVPLFVGVVLLLLLIATITHALLSTLRRRRGDLAVLRALGCSRRQLASMLRWQAFMLTVSALAVGVPLGLVANRFAWRAFTGRFGVAPATMTPVGLIAAGAAVTVALGLALASAAGFRAPRYARERPFAT